MTYHFPDAYAGQNVRRARTARPQAPAHAFPCRTQTKIRDTLNNLILQRPHRITNVAVLCRALPLLTPFPCHVQEVAPELADVGRPALFH